MAQWGESLRSKPYSFDNRPASTRNLIDWVLFASFTLHSFEFSIAFSAIIVGSKMVD